MHKGNFLSFSQYYIHARSSPLAPQCHFYRCLLPHASFVFLCSSLILLYTFFSDTAQSLLSLHSQLTSPDNITHRSYTLFQSLIVFLIIFLVLPFLSFNHGFVFVPSDLSCVFLFFPVRAIISSPLFVFFFFVNPLFLFSFFLLL